jgi:transposase
MRFLEEQIEQLDHDIVAKIQESGLEPHWQLVQSVPGLQATSAAAVLAETGTDMTQFPSEKHISSWPGFVPGTIGVRVRIGAVTPPAATGGYEAL